MHPPRSILEDSARREALLRPLMRRQLRLSITCAAAFLLALLGLPLANYFWPDALAQRLGGFTLSWLILGVLFYPFVWIISWIFIQRSMAIEAEDAQLALQSSPQSPPSSPSTPHQHPPASHP